MRKRTKSNSARILKFIITSTASKICFMLAFLLTLPFVLCSQTSDSIRAVQKDRARATGHAIVAAKNPGVNFSVLVIPWDGIGTLEENAQSQINTSWHAQAAVKGQYLSQAFDGTDFMYSSVILSESSFDSRKHLGTEWWIICSTLPPFSEDVNQTLWKSDGFNGIYPTSDSENLFLGSQAGKNSSSTLGNIFLGRYAGKENTSNYSIGIGRNALGNAMSSQNIAIGVDAGLNLTKPYNFFAGTRVGKSATEATANTAIGYDAMKSLTTGDFNLVLGHTAASQLTTGSYNLIFGARAGSKSIGAEHNIFMGYDAGYNNTSGLANVFIGRNSGRGHIDGNYNIYVGQNAGLLSNATHNIGLGTQSLRSSTGSQNLALGLNSGFSSTTANYNTYLGSYSGFNNISGERNVLLGYRSGYNETGSHKLYIENTDTDQPLVYGEFDNDILRVNGTFQVLNGNVGIGTETPTELLSINGKAIAHEYRATVDPAYWPDYVFSPTYQLTPLSEVEKHIADNGHLKNIPSEAEVAEDGIALGEMNAKLLEKIEELTLYLIEQDKRLDEQAKEMKIMKTELTDLKAQTNEK